MSDFDNLVAKVIESLNGLRTQAQEIADGGNGESYATLAFETTLLVEKLDERLGAVAKHIAGLAGDDEDISSMEELDTRITRICDDAEEDMCYAATGRYMRRHPDPDQARDEQIDRDLIDDREPRSDHWDA